MKATFLIMKKSIYLLAIVFLLGCGDYANSAESNSNKSSIEQISISPKAFEDSLSVLRKKIKSIEDEIVENSKSIEIIKEDINNIDGKVNEADNSFIGLFFLSIIINLIVLFVVLLLLLKKYLSKDNITKKVLKSDRFEEELNKRFNNLEVPQKELNKIDIRVKREIKLHQKEKTTPITEEVQSKNNINNKNKNKAYEPPKPIKFLSGNEGNRFNTVDTSSDNSFFKIINEKGDTAEFEFSGLEAEAIAKKVFNEHISKITSGSLKTAQSVKTIKQGEIKRVGDYWVVTKPIEVELI